MVDFPVEQVEARALEANALGDEIRQALDEVEYELAGALPDVPPDAFGDGAILIVRYALLSCFTDPICAPGDARPICVRRHQAFDPSAAIRVQLDERAPVYGYRACELPPSDNFEASVGTWTAEEMAWFRRRVVLVDSLRVRLKALIPSRLDELDVRMQRYDAELQQLYNEAEDVWREAQRVQRRADQRRRDEEAWERFQQEMLQFEETLALIRLDVERLREHQRDDVRAVAVRIATLGSAEF